MTYVPSPPRPCAKCGSVFAGHGNTKYCSGECRKQAWSPRGPLLKWTCEICSLEFADTRQRRWCDGCREAGNRLDARDKARAKAKARQCVDCGAAYHRRGRSPRCDPCLAAERERRRAERLRLAITYWRPCVGCGAQMGPRTKSDVRQFHSPECWSAWTRAQKPRRVLTSGPCGLCGENFTAVGAQHRYCSSRCEKRAARQIRRARLKGLKGVEPIHPPAIFERDGWICRLCRKPVEREAVVPANLAATIDHILPLAFGGLHEPSNVQCAHFICNSRKSANVEQLSFAA